MFSGIKYILHQFDMGRIDEAKLTEALKAYASLRMTGFPSFDSMALGIQIAELPPRARRVAAA